jgi:hypothetical protein
VPQKAAFTVKEDCRVDMPDPLTGERSEKGLHFSAGSHSPRNELEEQALAHLVSLGLAKKGAE